MAGRSSAAIRAWVLLGLVALSGFFATMSVLGGAGWTHHRFTERTVQSAVVIDLWTKGSDVVLAVTEGNTTTEVRSCRDGALVESFQGWRVERLGFGRDCTRWAGERLMEFRQAALEAPAASRQDLGGGVTRYSDASGTSFDLDLEGFPIAARYADGTTVSWEPTGGGPGEPVEDLPSSSWERYERVEARAIAEWVALNEVPTELVGFALDDCVLYATSDGVTSAHVSWRLGDETVELVVTSAGVPLEDVKSGISVSNDGASMTLLEGASIVQIHGPDEATVVQAAAGLQSAWGRAAQDD